MMEFMVACLAFVDECDESYEEVDCQRNDKEHSR